LNPQRVVNSLGQAGEIGIESANNYTRMIWTAEMQPYEVFAVQGDKSSPFSGGESENSFVGYGVARMACLMAGENVVSKRPQGFDGRERKVLVCVDLRHSMSQAASFSRMSCSISSRCAR